MSKYSREDIVDAAKKAVKQNDGILSRSDFQRLTGINQSHIYALFPEGGWSEVLELAGIAQHPKHNVPLSDEEILIAYHRVASDIGNIPTWSIFQSKANISKSTVQQRFGGKSGILQRYLLWLSQNSPDSLLVGIVQDQLGQGVAEQMISPNTTKPNSSLPRWSIKKNEIEYGEPINFRGLQHAPINEIGVVYLFGMISHEIGYMVEAMRTAYPDCEAKRRISSGRWQRVLIEFEYQSSNFHQHGHDPQKCDLIICWEHNWVNCPLEVLELRSLIQNLKG